MADQPSDVRWPPSNDIDFDDVYDRLVDLKERHFPEHTVRDLADPVIQILVLQAAMGQHAFGRLNHALLQLAPKTATSRRALISIMEVVNRPLLPIQPSRGPAYGRLKSGPIASQVLIESGQRISQPSTTDPTFTVDDEVAAGDTVLFDGWLWDESSQTLTANSTWPAPSVSADVEDYLVIGFKELFFDSLDIGWNGTPIPGSVVISWEYRNDEAGPVDSVTINGSLLDIDITTYLNGTVPDGLEVTITYKPTNVTETVKTDSGIVQTSFLGQDTPSVSSTDYEVIADWRPIPNVVDGTANGTQDGVVSWTIADLKSDTNDWVEDDTFGWAVRARFASGSITGTFGLDRPTNTQGEFYAQVNLTQGVRKTISIGQTDGTTFQFMPVSVTPISEPVADPELSIQVGADTDWFVVDDFSNSGPSSRHAIFREDPDEGWGLVFGDGTLGELPTQGQSVRVTLRTDSVNPGDLDPDTSIVPRGGVGLVTDFVLYRGTEGYDPPEASDLASVLRFRFGVLPQLSLRAQSAITAQEIVQALTGGAPNRATFTTADGRKPFSRALFSLTGAGPRQYRVLVVGDESNPDGTVDSNDLDEAEDWLNGSEIGVEVVEGHGPQNTEAIVGSFVAKAILPTVTLTVTNVEGVRAQAESIIREFFQPHARDEDGEFRWEFGGSVPMPILFGLLWESIPNRVFVDIEATDGTTVWQDGDSIPLDEFELPTLDPTFDPLVDIVVTVT